MTTWKPIETAPKGNGPGDTRDPDHIDPPQILLQFSSGEVSVGYWDWYYASGGHGYEGGLAWIEPCSGDRLDLHYEAPTEWMYIPGKDVTK